MLVVSPQRLDGQPSEVGKRYFLAPGATVALSPRGSQRQTVLAGYHLQRLTTSGFATVETVQESVVLDGQKNLSPALRGASFQTAAGTVGSPERYRVTYSLTWKDSATGHVLDTRTVTPTMKSNGLCLGSQGPACVVGSDGVIRLS
jgi:hypothetical protein